MKRGSLTKHIFCLINLDLDKMEAEEKISPLQNFRVHSCDLFVCVATAHLLTCRFSGKDCKDANRAPPNDLPQCVSLCSDQGLPFHKLCKWKLGPQGPFFHWRSNLNFFPSLIALSFPVQLLAIFQFVSLQWQHMPSFRFFRVSLFWKIL